MRLFIAAEIDPTVRGALAEAIDELRSRATRLAPGARITWVKPEQLHITVQFIGHVDAAAGGGLLAALAPPLAAPVCTLTIRGTGTFPPRRPPRVVWAGVDAGADALHVVEREVRDRLASLVSREERGYHPHVTLGRVKEPAGIRPVRLLAGFEHTDFGAVRVEAVTLFESRTAPTGSIYVPLGRTPLAHTS